MPRAEDGRFDDLLSRDDVERLVCSTAIRHPGFRLVKEGTRIAVTDYTVDLPWRPTAFTGVADVERVVDEFERGATIVLQGLHFSVLQLALFCRQLEGFLGHPVQANAYYTPRASQGLAVHHDTHDVFVLQISGRKRWLVYEPALELPLKHQRYSASGRPGEPVFDTTLAPGDTLYLPRGWLHEAVTSDEDSLHLTIGVNVYTWLDAFRAALDACDDDVEFRRSVADDGEAPPGLLDALADRLDPEQVVRRRRARLVSTRRPIRDGQLSELRALDRLTLETALERRAGVLFDLRGGDGQVALAFDGKQVVFPGRVGAELEFVASAEGAFRAADLPGRLDERGRLVLVRRLVREGFLRVTPPDGRDGRLRRSGAGA